MANDPIRSLPLIIMIFKLEYDNNKTLSNIDINGIIAHTFNVTYNKIINL